MPLANTAIDTLEHWSRHGAKLSAIFEPHFAELLPLLDSYLKSNADLGKNTAFILIYIFVILRVKQQVDMLVHGFLSFIFNGIFSGAGLHMVFVRTDGWPATLLDLAK